jgi:hypothetical protein
MLESEGTQAHPLPRPTPDTSSRFVTTKKSSRKRGQNTMRSISNRFSTAYDWPARVSRDRAKGETM